MPNPKGINQYTRGGGRAAAVASGRLDFPPPKPGTAVPGKPPPGFASKGKPKASNATKAAPAAAKAPAKAKPAPKVKGTPSRAETSRLIKAAVKAHGAFSPQHQALIQQSVKWARERDAKKAAAFKAKQG